MVELTEKESSWNNMDSAPRDGSHILIYWEEGYSSEGYWGEIEEDMEYVPGFVPVILNYHGRVYCSEPSIPVAWQPLPSRPEFL